MAKELGETMDDNELLEMIERADSDNDGLVSLDDFYNIMTKKTFAWIIIINNTFQKNICIFITVAPL